MEESRWTWTLGNTLEDLADFQGQLRHSLDAQAFPAELIFNLELVLEELLSNTIHYGFEVQQKSTIEVGLRFRQGQMWVQLLDQGRAFNPLEAEARPEDKIGGWGLPLVKELVESFDYQRLEGSNQLILSLRCPD